MDNIPIWLYVSAIRQIKTYTHARETNTSPKKTIWPRVLVVDHKDAQGLQMNVIRFSNLGSKIYFRVPVCHTCLHTPHHSIKSTKILFVGNEMRNAAGAFQQQSSAKISMEFGFYCILHMYHMSSLRLVSLTTGCKLWGKVIEEHSMRFLYSATRTSAMPQYTMSINRH